MDFLNKTYSRLIELFRSMTPATRITTGLLLAVIVISLVYIFYYQTTGAEEYLLGGREFSQRELANMTAAFSKAGLEKWEIVGNRLRVGRGEKAKYMAALADGQALPEDFTRYIDDALDAGGSWITPRYVFEQRLKEAKQDELSLIITRMKGVEYARVRFEQDDKRSFRPTDDTRALAVVKPEGNNELDEERAETIRRTVMAGVNGLKADNVTVTDLNSGRAFNGATHSGIPGVSDGVYLAHKRRWEKEYVDLIRKRLVKYPGVVVAVNVDLNEEISRQETKQEYDPKPVPLNIVESTESQSSTNPSRGGRPGVASNGGISNSAAAVSVSEGAESTTEKTQSQQRSVASTTNTVINKAGLIPTRVTASIGVPSSYYELVWRQQNPAPQGQEPKQPSPEEIKAIETTTIATIQGAVENLLRKGSVGEDPSTHVSVKTDQTLPTEPNPEPAMTDRAFSWLAGNWQTLGMIFVSLCGLVMLRKMIGSLPSKAPAPAAAADTTQPQLSVVGADDAEQEPGTRKSRLKRFGSNGPNLREELTELVKEDPDAAATILRNWIGDAA